MDSLIDYELYLGNQKTSIYNILNKHPNTLIGLYFSGKYCPYCSHFTPRLIEFYDEIKKEYNNFEIIFVSSDKTLDEFLNYYNDMPWYTLPYKKRDLKKELCNKFEVKTIPTLIFFNKNGNLIERNGKDFVDKYFYNIDKFIEILNYKAFQIEDNLNNEF